MEKEEKMLTSKEVGEIIGRDARTVQMLAKTGILTCEKKGNRNLYNLYTVVREYCDYLAKSGTKKISSLEEQKRAEDIRLKKAKADTAELELQELKGSLHAAQDVEDMTTDLVMSVRSAFLAMPGKISVELAAISDATELSERLKAEICEALDDLSNYKYDRDEYKRRVRERRGWFREEQEED